MYIKKSGINNLKVLFLFHRLLYNLLEKRIKIGDRQTNFLSGEQNLPLPPHIFRIFQNKTLWSVLFKKSGINNLKVLFLFQCLCARLFICALWSPAGKGLTSWLSLVVSNCEFVTFPLVSWVRCGT